VTDIVHILSTLSISISRSRQPLEQLKVELMSEVTQAEKKLAKAPDQVVIATLKKKTIEFAAALPKVPHDPGQALEALSKELASLDQAWRDALLGQLGPKDPKAVKASLDIQDFSVAVTATVASYTGGSLLSAVPAVATGTSPWPSDLRPDSASRPVQWFRSLLLPLDLPRRAERTTLTPQNQIFLAKSLQSLLLFVLVGLGGIMLYQNKFVGTFEDFATIFFWAFGLDITIDAVRQATKPRTG
jgi:hypothetical protein